VCLSSVGQSENGLKLENVERAFSDSSLVSSTELANTDSGLFFRPLGGQEFSHF